MSSQQITNAFKAFIRPQENAMRIFTTKICPRHFSVCFRVPPNFEHFVDHQLHQSKIKARKAINNFRVILNKIFVYGRFTESFPPIHSRIRPFWVLVIVKNKLIMIISILSICPLIDFAITLSKFSAELLA